MEFVKTRDGSALIVVVTGRVDTNTAPALEKDILGDLTGVDALIYDFSHVIYLSSAGLRILLLSHKAMAGQGKSFVLRKPQPEVKEILDMTGFTNFLTIEE